MKRPRPPRLWCPVPLRFRHPLLSRLPLLLALAASLAAARGAAGRMAEFADHGQVNEEVGRDDPRIRGWATEVNELHRGPRDWRQPELGSAEYGSEADVLGSQGTGVSLGDGGWIVLSFDVTITNGEGIDLAVFENGFARGDEVYMELGFVEVSSDGVHFARLPSLCRRTSQPGPFVSSAPADFYNLGGNFLGGTGIDLSDLIEANDPAVSDGTVDLNSISYVRIVDVVGDVGGEGGTRDFLGRPVADPYPTAFVTSGMDVSGVAVLHAHDTPVAVSTWGRIKAGFMASDSR